MFSYQASVRLMQILQFTPQDVEYNNRGHLSPAQHEMLKLRKESAIAAGQRAMKGTPIVTLYLVVVVAVIGAIFVSTGSFQSVRNALGGLTIPVVGGVAFVLLLIVTTVPRSYRRSVARYQQMAATLPIEYPLRYVQGNMKFKTQSTGGSADTPGYITNYYVSMENKDFHVDRNRHDALKQAVGKHDIYRLYFADTGKSGIILSVEPVHLYEVQSPFG